MPKAVTTRCWEVRFSVLLVTESGPTHPLQSCLLDKSCCWLTSCQRSNNLTQEPSLTLKLFPAGCVQPKPHLQNEVGRCLSVLLNSLSKKLGNASLFFTYLIYTLMYWKDKIFSNKGINVFSSYLVQAPQWLLLVVSSELPLKLFYFWEKVKDPILLGNNFNSLFCQPQTRVAG